MSPPDSRPILLCYDRSPGARRAIECAGSLFPGRRALVVYVWTPLIVWAAAHGARVPASAFKEEEYIRLAGEAAADGVRIAVEAGLEATPTIQEGTLEGTWRAILKAADAHDASLIVLGARGLSSFQSIVLGSVSQGVVHHARRPVLVVPPETPA